MPTHPMRDLLDGAFEELALVLGGAFAVHQVGDEAVWQIMKGVESVHGKAVSMLDGMAPKASRTPDRSPYEPHPAVEAMLRKLRKEIRP